jgi:hypothetical protein
VIPPLVASSEIVVGHVNRTTPFRSRRAAIWPSVPIIESALEQRSQPGVQDINWKLCLWIGRKTRAGLEQPLAFNDKILNRRRVGVCSIIVARSKWMPSAEEYLKDQNRESEAVVLGRKRLASFPSRSFWRDIW